MSFPWLAAMPSAPQWADLPWTAFAAEPVGTALLPVFGIADHGTGQARDLEEVLGSALLDTALGHRPSGIRVLPPFRFGPAPYGHTHYGLPLECIHTTLLELGQSLKVAGTRQLAFFVTSPWQEEWISACAVDVRERTGLVTFVTSLRGLNLDLHPTSRERGEAAKIGEWLGAGTRAPGHTLASGRSTAFRPGHFPHPALPPHTRDGAPEARFREAAALLRTLLAEIVAYPHPPASPQALVLPDRFPLFAEGYRSHYLPALSEKEFSSRVKVSEALAVIPTGAIEQHGPHLPLSVDAVLGQAYLAEAFKHLPPDAPIWVTPPVVIGSSNEHAAFPGTLTVSTLTLRATIRALVQALHKRGFQRIAILNTHGGNSAVLVPTLRELQVELGVRAGVIGQLFKPELHAQEAAFGFHAGEWETSLTLALLPNQVIPGAAVREYPAALEAPGHLRPGQAPATLAWLTRDLSKSGVMGDATLGTAAKGQTWLDAMGRSLAQRLLDLAGA